MGEGYGNNSYVTHRHICPADHKSCLSTQKKGVETQMIYGEVHPTLTRNMAFPVAARVI